MCLYAVKTPSTLSHILKACKHIILTDHSI